MKKDTSILIVGTGSLLNYGCEAIVQGTYVILKTLLPDCRIYVASDDFEYDSQILPSDIHLVKYKNRFSLYRIYKGLLRRIFHIGKGTPVRMIYSIGNKYDVILSCGGDNFCEAPHGRLYYILLDLMKIGNVAVRNDKKYGLWGASVGPFSKKNEAIIINHLSKCDFINVRENLSFNYLTQFEQIKNKVNQIADPAFCLKPVEVSFERENGYIYIGINISLLAISHSVAHNQEKIFIQQLFEQLDSVLDLNEKYQFLLIPHVISDPDGPQNDFIFMNKYIEYSKHKDRISILPLNLGAAKTKGYIKKMDLLIAARMHCCVGGISAGTPTLFITYSNKGIGMSFYAYNHHEYEITCQELISEKFPQKIKTILFQKEEIREYLNNQYTRFYNDAMRSGEYICKAINIPR
jgi:polysaccharide pyruvyl transferase WcaK-like protein